MVHQQNLMVVMKEGGGGGGGVVQRCDGLASHPGRQRKYSLSLNARETRISSGLNGHQAQTHALPNYFLPYMYSIWFVRKINVIHDPIKDMYKI